MQAQPYLDIGKPLGSWLWNVSYYVVNPDGMFEFCKKNKVTELYISINRDVTDMRYAELIKRSAAHGIRVAALTGDPSWILVGRRQSYYDYLERVENINRLCGSGPKFYSLHMDVEPHVLPEAKRDGVQQFVPEFTELIRDARINADRLGVELEWDIPAWFWQFTDEEENWSLPHTVFKYCDSVGIMAYSDSPERQLEVALPNIEIAKKMGKTVMLGSETMDLDEARREDGNCSISYYEEGKIYMYRSLNELKAMAEPLYDNFGFAIHDFQQWMALQPGMLPRYAATHTAL